MNDTEVMGTDEEPLYEATELQYNPEEIVERIEEFMSDSDSAYSSLKDRIKNDKTFLSGTQFSDLDNKIIGQYRFKDVLNIVSNSCNAIANQYYVHPYSWYTENDIVNRSIDIFLKDSSIQNAAPSALYNAITTGLGVLVMSTDVNPYSGAIEPTLYSVNNIENVYLDPSMVNQDGSDAQEAVIIEVKSKKFIRNQYGEELVATYRAKGFTNVPCNSKIEQVIATYFRTNERGTVDVFTVTNNKVASHAELHTRYIPVVPVFGEQIWVNGKMSYQGIVAKCKSIQKMLNLCYMQLAERMIVNPRAQWVARRSEIEGVESYWKDANKNMNPLLIVNDKDSDGKPITTQPTRISNTIEYNDLTGIMQSVISLMASITGVQAIGLSEREQTASQVIIERSAYQNNIRHYYEHLKVSFKQLGRIFLDLLQVPIKQFNVIQGLDEFYENMEARSTLNGLLQVYQNDPAKQQAIVNGILATYPDNFLINAVAAQLQGNVTDPQVAQLHQQIQQQNNAMQQMQQQLQAAQLEVQNYNKSLALQQMQMQMDYQLEQEKMRIDLIKNSANNDADMQQLVFKEQEKSKRELANKLADVVKDNTAPDITVPEVMPVDVPLVDGEV